MIGTLAISGYRSIRDLVLSLDRLNVITGANGSGKSSLYRAVRLLSDAASNSAISSLAREGGLPSTLWAGPEMISRAVRRGEYPVEPIASRKPVSLKLGFASETYGYSIDFGYPPPPPPATAFTLDPAIKRECIWHGAVYRNGAALVERRNALVSIASGHGEQPVILTNALSSADSMLATIADPQRTPEILLLRDSIRGWRFYDGFRTDHSPLRVVDRSIAYAATA